MEEKINKYVLLFNVIWFPIVMVTFTYLKDKHSLNFWLTVILAISFELLGTYLFRKVTKIYN
jgi:hypothetical protein